MSGPAEHDSRPKQRRSPRFPFDSLVRVATHRLGQATPLWGRSTNLSCEGIGMTVMAGQLIPEELIGMEIALPSAGSVSIKASVRYCNEVRCGCEFVEMHDLQREAILSACERLRKAGRRG
jgi:c-di-GMP-binding flagellar brake protein YcgR